MFRNSKCLNMINLNLAVVAIAIFSFVDLSCAASDPNVTIVITAVQNYAYYLNTEQCEKWADLFAQDGIKYDEPAPTIGIWRFHLFADHQQDTMPLLPSVRALTRTSQPSLTLSLVQFL